MEEGKGNRNDKPTLGTQVGRIKRKLDGSMEVSASQREDGGQDKDLDIGPDPVKE